MARTFDDEMQHGREIPFSPLTLPRASPLSRSHLDSLPVRFRESRVRPSSQRRDGRGAAGRSRESTSNCRRRPPYSHRRGLENFPQKMLVDNKRIVRRPLSS